MMKALLIVSALGSFAPDSYEVEMSSMTECLEARIAIMEQMKDAKTLCIPAVAEADKMEQFFSVFMNIVERMREMENERLNAEAYR